MPLAQILLSFLQLIKLVSNVWLDVELPKQHIILISEKCVDFKNITNKMIIYLLYPMLDNFTNIKQSDLPVPFPLLNLLLYDHKHYIR